MTPIRLTLAGVALGAVMDGMSATVRMLRPRVFDYMRYWDVGALTGRGMDVVTAISPFVVLGLLLALAATRSLNAVALGDDLARSLGASVTRTRVLCVLSVTLLAGAAMAAVGPIGFVGLMVPHAARWIVGPDQRWIFAYTVVGAPVLVLAADIVGPAADPPGRAVGGRRHGVPRRAGADLADPPATGERAVKHRRGGRTSAAGCRVLRLAGAASLRAGRPHGPGLRRIAARRVGGGGVRAGCGRVRGQPARGAAGADRRGLVGRTAGGGAVAAAAGRCWRCWSARRWGWPVRSSSR